MDRAADITTIGPPEISNGERRLLPPSPHDLIDAITSGAIAHHAAITPRGAAPTSLHSPLQSVQQAETFMADSSTRFGFVVFAETWNGRLAMLGFVIGLATELLTGQGVLAQIGLG